MIVGKETVKLFHKAYEEEDEYGNPVEVESEVEINNVLVGHNSSTIYDTIIDISAEVDLTIYINSSWDGLIANEDEFEYNGRRFQIVDAPVLWHSFKGSRLKPKLIIGLKYK